MLDHEHKSGETCSDSIKTLSDISSGFNNDETDSVAYLKQYKTLLQSICNCLYTSAHETLPGLSGVLQEGIDLLINEKRALTEYEFSFLQTIPEIFSEYVFIPESKVPDARLLSHLKNRQWIRPLSNEEEKAFIQLLMSPPAKSTKAPETVSEKSTTIEPKESHTPQNNTEPFPGQIKADRNTETGTAFIEKNTLKLVETEAGSNDTKAPHKKTAFRYHYKKPK